MKIVVQHVLNAHPYLRTEAPLEPWQPEADDETFFRMLGELIAHGLGRGNDLGDLTLSFANVVVDDDAPPMPAGELVAVSIRGAGDWSPERTWRPDGDDPDPFVSRDLEDATREAGVVYAYTRQLSTSEGSITVLFPRAVDGPSTD